MVLAKKTHSNPFSELGMSASVFLFVSFYTVNILGLSKLDPHILIASSSRYYTRIFSLLDEESNHTETGMCEYG